jgi:hypothetical protein
MQEPAATRRVRRFAGPRGTMTNAGPENLMPPEIPDFDAAVARLHGLLAELGQPLGQPLWVFREDVSTHAGRFRVKVPLPAANERFARARYEQGRALGVGVCLEVLARLGRRYCCACWFVRDPEESARSCCRGLKLRVWSTEPARPVRGWLAWAVHRWLDRRAGVGGPGGFLPTHEEQPPAE